MRGYIITLEHSKGMHRVKTYASSPDSAVKQVCDAEGAPFSAVRSVTDLNGVPQFVAFGTDLLWTVEVAARHHNPDELETKLRYARKHKTLQRCVRTAQAIVRARAHWYLLNGKWCPRNP